MPRLPRPNPVSPVATPISPDRGPAPATERRSSDPGRTATPAVFLGRLPADPTDLPDDGVCRIWHVSGALKCNFGGTTYSLAPGGGTPATFLVLTDTPGSYSGQTLKAVRVNAGETALEFYSAAAGGGDVVGPAGATDHALARFDTATGKEIENSLVLCDDSGNITGVLSLRAGTLEADALTPDSTVAGNDIRIKSNPNNGSVIYIQSWYTGDVWTNVLSAAGGIPIFSARAGQSVTFTAPLAMSTNQITGLTAGSAGGHSVEYNQALLAAVARTLTAAITLGAGGKIDAAGVTGEIVVQTGTAAPAHDAAIGVLFWDYTNKKLYGKHTAGAGAGNWEQIAGGGGSTPTGTGFRHVVSGVEDAAAKLVDTADINPDQVTYAKIQNVAADKVLGRTTGSGDIEEIACTAVGRALLDDATVIAQRTTLELRRQWKVRLDDATQHATDDKCFSAWEASAACTFTTAVVVQQTAGNAQTFTFHKSGAAAFATVSISAAQNRGTQACSVAFAVGERLTVRHTVGDAGGVRIEATLLETA